MKQAATNPRSKPIGKNGKPLAGAALKSFTIKRNGNAVAGTAKIMKKGHAERVVV